MALPILKKGYYITSCGLNVHNDPGLSLKKRGTVEKGTVLEICDIQILNHSVWGKFEAGWICMHMHHTDYVKRVEAKE